MYRPASAAGIFSSNLGENKVGHSEGHPDQAAFERALGQAVLDAGELYQQAQDKSLEVVRKAFPALML